MAKQNVTFIERHVEKLLLGVAGAVLLLVVAAYLVLSPHTAQVGTESLSPKELYADLSKQCEDARQRLAGAAPRPPDKQATLVNPTPSPSEPVPSQVAVSPVPPNPMPREVRSTGPLIPPQKVELAQILPPAKPLLTSGHGSARIPATKVISLDNPTDASSHRTSFEEPTRPQDWIWVTAVSAISRRAQRLKFVDTGYAPERLELIVAEVLVQRQERLPNGGWSEPGLVRPYEEERIDARPEIELRRQEDDYLVQKKDADYLIAYRTKLESVQEQARTVRQPFQHSLVSGSIAANANPYEWKIPDEIDSGYGEKLDLKKLATNLGVQFPPDKEATGDKHGTSGGKGKHDSVWATRTLKEAQQLLDKKEYLKAEPLILSLKDKAEKEVSPANRKEADRLSLDHQADFEQAHFDELDAIRRRAEVQGVCKLGPDVEPVWITDNTVESGKVYRYRLALRALNQYAGWAAALANPLDAAKLVVQGEWSDWSDPVAAPLAKCLLVAEVNKSSGNAARWELHRRLSGVWESLVQEFAVGDALVFPRKGSAPVSYDAIVLGVDPAHPYERRNQSKKGYDSDTTAAVLLVDARGEIEQHTLPDDIRVKRELTDTQRKEKQEKEKAENVKETGKTGRPAGPAPKQTPTGGAYPPPKKQPGEGRSGGGRP